MGDLRPDARAMRELLDRADIMRALSRYCRGVDRCDAPLIQSAFHDDAIDDHAVWRGPAHEFATFCAERIAQRWRVTQHALGQTTIELDGDAARVETYYLAVHDRGDGPERYLFRMGGRYVDRFERRDGSWKIALRRVVHDWSSVLRGTAGFDVRDAFPQGAQDRSDPVYERV